MKVTVIANSAKCSLESFDEVLRLIEEQHEVVGTSFAENEICMTCCGKCDVVVVLGGDGTIISAAHFFGKNQVPIIGVNLGKLGYLANFSYDEFCDIVLEGAFPKLLTETSERMLLGTRINDCDVIAVNDIVIDIGHPFRAVTVQVHIDGKRLTNVHGDGVIISTPTGSTAYNLSAGGPILQPEIDVIAITPKNPHALSFRPLVVSGSSTIRLTVEQYVGAHVIIDGQKVVPVSELDGDGDGVVKITRFESNLSLIENRLYDWKVILREKLKWGI